MPSSPSPISTAQRQSDESVALPHVPSQTGELRIAMAQIASRAANIPYNLEVALRTIDRAEKEGVDLVIFPEAHLAGYFALDRFENKRFIQACERATQIVVAATRGKKVAVAIGSPRLNPSPGHENEKPFNSMIIIEDGKITHTVDKRLMAGTTRDRGQGDIFWDDRYFQPGKEVRTFLLKGKRIGMCICEDMFHSDHDENVPETLLAEKPDVLIIPAVSPANFGKFETRMNLLRPLAEKHGTEIVYVNSVGTYDGYEGEVAVDGKSFALGEDGTIRALGKSFEEDFIVHTVKGSAAVIEPKYRDVEDLHHALIQGIRDYFARNGGTKAIIGSSGGIDSALDTCLLAEALGPENVIAVTMPSHITSEETLADAKAVPEAVGVPCQVRPIGRIYQAWLEDRLASGEGEPKSITKQNFQARIRMGILMEIANEIPGAFVINNTNKTEAFMGYGTLYGDLAGAFGPLMDVNKMRVYDLAEYVNERAGRAIIPQSVLTRPPTAELEKGQTDEANLPAPYPILAPLVDKIVETTPSPQELVAWLGSEFGIEETKALQIVVRTLSMIDISEHKRRQTPPGLRVTRKSGGSGRRIPLSRDAFNEITVHERLAGMERQGEIR
jgi:NAD+ synthase (glutamine-hydrolysing)